jgi:A/G-specific adenine glycosylase
MAFSQPQAILDGNVKRVLTRFFGIEGWPGQSTISKQLWLLSEQLTPIERVADYTQAMMDLGATLCTRSKPNCQHCPIATDCVARLTGRIHQLPAPKKQQKIPTKYCYMPVLTHPQFGIYLEKRAPQGIWGGLWSLPEHPDKDSLIQWLNQLGIAETGSQWLPSRKHTFSHFHLEFQTVVVQIDNLNQINEAGQSSWYHPDKTKLALPAPIQKLMNELMG